MKASETPEFYPTQFKDKIDEYLWKEHHILGGCCSSIESVKYAVAREVVEKLTDVFIEKAANWLRTHSEADYFELIPDYNYCGAGNLNKKKMIEDFEKYVRGE